MAINKNKVIAAAQKYVQKGQFDRAIKEYVKIVEVEPTDVRTVIHVSDAGTGAPITQIATTTEGEEAGAYRAILPPGVTHSTPSRFRFEKPMEIPSQP